MLGWTHNEDGRAKVSGEINSSIPANQKYLVAIEDPYEKGFNLGRHINVSTFPVLKAQFLKEWVRMNTEVPQDIVFKRIAAMAIKRGPSSCQSGVANQSVLQRDLERSQAIENTLKSLREHFYKSDACGDIYSRIPLKDGALEIVPTRIPATILQELLSAIGPKDNTLKIMKHLVRLFAAASMEFSIKYIPGQIQQSTASSEMEVWVLPIEAAVIKVIHASIISSSFDRKTFTHHLGYLPHQLPKNKSLCASCVSPTQSKYFSPKPFRASVRAYATATCPDVKHVVSLLKKQRRIL